MPLNLCPQCARHVRADESACPFCHAALPPADSHARARRLGALFASSALLSACMIMPQPVPVYGAPIPPTSPSPRLPGEGPSASPSPQQ